MASTNVIGNNYFAWRNVVLEKTHAGLLSRRNNLSRGFLRNNVMLYCVFTSDICKPFSKSFCKPHIINQKAACGSRATICPHLHYTIIQIEIWNSNYYWFKRKYLTFCWICIKSDCMLKYLWSQAVGISNVNFLIPSV